MHPEQFAGLKSQPDRKTTMTVEKMEQLRELLREFRDEFTDDRKYGEDNPILLDILERRAIDSAGDIVFDYYMKHEYPEWYRRNHRHERLSREEKKALDSQ